ncbi:hypothetical protein NYE24_27950 [Paenibacillus sp. FSL H7-0350]|uniref:hypothetical protein n=1 Tax=Paenibacillus sp. FSL H7-0350 TaxID=2975345 RepID=UPI0031592BB8
MYQQLIESLHQVKNWVGQVPWGKLYHQVKDGVEFATNVLELFLITKANDKQDEQLPPQHPTPPYPYIPSSRRRKQNTKYRRRNIRKRK